MIDWDKKNRDTSFSFFKKGMVILWDLIGRGNEKRNFILVLFWLVVITVLNLSLPYLLKLIFDEISYVGEIKQISNYITYIIITMFLLKAISLYIDRFVKEYYLINGLIKLDNFWPVMAQEKLLTLSLGYHEKENTGKKIAKIEKGCNKLLEILMNLFWNFLPQLFYLIINITFILIIDWKLGILFLIPLIPAVLLNVKCFDKFAPLWDKCEEQKEISSGLFCQSLINVATVQGFVQENREKSNFSAVRQKMSSIDIGISLKMQKYFFFVGLLLNSFFILTISVGIYFVYTGQSTIGTVVYIIATGNTTNESILHLIHIYMQIMKNIISVIRMKDLIDENIDIKNSSSSITPRNLYGNFRFENVTFSYRGKCKPVLDNISLDISSDQMVALVSKTGEGKTTIIRLLCRMYDVQDGAILLDGKDIRDIDLFWYRRLFAVVQQDVDIFDTSILDNIRYAYPEASINQVLESIEASHMGIVVNNKERFPDGLDTQVGERGVRLSGGERQRVGIARAYLSLLNGVKVLVLDEATSSLDSEAERAIQEMIDKLRNRMSISIVAIAHRLSTIRKADMIYVISNGVITEKGDHDRLISKNGLYSRLVELQKLGSLRD